MPRPSLRSLVPALVLAVSGHSFIASPSELSADEPDKDLVTVTTLSGEDVRGRRLVAIDKDKIRLSASPTSKEVALDDVIAIRFATAPDPPPAPDPKRVIVDLWSGEALPGTIEAGDDEAVELRTGLCGPLRVSLDHVAGVRFPDRLSRAAEPPDLSTSGDSDVIHLTRGDRLSGTVEAFTADGVKVATEGERTILVPFARMTALRLVDSPPPVTGSTEFAVVLRDGTRIRGTHPTVLDGRLSLASVSDFKVKVGLADVVAVHVMNQSLRYVSDVEPQKIEVKTFWKTVAGDPNVLYAPRMDRSFGGAPLSCAGRSWVKGIGVYGGTSITWKLDKQYREFRTEVGLDDGAGPGGGVVFEVLVDGKVRWTSGFVRAAASKSTHGRAGPVDAGRIKVSGAQTLTLRVLFGDETDPYPVQDQADWLGAMLIR